MKPDETKKPVVPHEERRSPTNGPIVACAECGDYLAVVKLAGCVWVAAHSCRPSQKESTDA